MKKLWYPINFFIAVNMGCISPTGMQPVCDEMNEEIDLNNSSGNDLSRDSLDSVGRNETHFLTPEAYRVIIHSAPDQKYIDSIKKEKLKKKY